MIKISRVHPATGELNYMTLNMTEEEYRSWLSGNLIQYACPRLTADDREFLMTGLLPTEYDAIFPEEEE